MQGPGAKQRATPRQSLFFGQVPHNGLPVVAGRHEKARIQRVALQHMRPEGVAAQPLLQFP